MYSDLKAHIGSLGQKVVLRSQERMSLGRPQGGAVGAEDCGPQSFKEEKDGEEPGV